MHDRQDLKSDHYLFQGKEAEVLGDINASSRAGHILGASTGDEQDHGLCLLSRQ